MTKPITPIHYEIANGDKGIYETVDYMWNYALRDANTPLAKALVKELKGKTKLETIRNIFDWVVANVSYKLDPPEYEMVTAPIHYLNGNRKTGDCDCMTTLLVCLLETAGFDSAITIIKWRLDEYTHVFAEVWYDNDWFVLDPTLGGQGFGKQDKKINEFKRTTKQNMAKLVVLADGEESTENTTHKIKRIPHRSCGYGSRNGCCPDNNQNNNNININFGTSVASTMPVDYAGASNTPVNYPNYAGSSNNEQKANTNNKQINNKQPQPVSLPSAIAKPKYDVARPNKKERPVSLCPVVRDGKLTWVACNTISNKEELQEALDNIQQQLDNERENDIEELKAALDNIQQQLNNEKEKDVSNNDELKELLDNIQQQIDNNKENGTSSNNTSNNNDSDIVEQLNNLPADTQVIVADGAKPKYVPPTKQRKPSYVEFP